MNPPGMVFSLDVGGTRTKSGLIDLSSRQVLAQAIGPTCSAGLDAFLDDISVKLENLCRAAGLQRSAVEGCGIGLPGYVSGNWVSALWETITFLEGSRFLPALGQRLGIPVRADNDARVVALGEAYFGGHGPVQRLLSLTLGSGLGFGLVVDGRLQEPTSINHLAGHIPIRPNAQHCYCGFNGCLEVLVNTSGLLQDYHLACQGLALDSNLSRPAPESSLNVESVFEAARSNEPAALLAVRQWLADLTAGLNAYIYLFGPEIIVLGGGMSKGLSPWMAELQAGLFAAPFEGYQVRVVVSQVQELAGVLGAAALFA